MAERWLETYEQETEIYDAFSRYEDDGNRLLNRLHAGYSFQGKTALEIGCGAGKYTRLLAPRCARIFGLDNAAPMLSLARRRCHGLDNAHFLLASADAIPLASGAADVVFSSWALGSLAPHLPGTLEEAHRVLRTGGEIWLFENHWTGAFMDLRGQEAQEWDQHTVRWLERQGLELVSVVETGFAFPNLAEARRILGFLFGNAALHYLEAHPDPRLHHRAVLLHGRS